MSKRCPECHAVNEAMRSADADAASTMQSITGGLNLGGLGL